MGETLLATSGDTIKLWDSATYAFYQEIPSESGHVSKLAWNQDGQCLASLRDSGKEIYLSAICGKSEANIGVVRGIEAPTCLNFACRSPHYLGVGSALGTVTIWNVKSQTKKKTFTPTDRAITKVAFSQSDSHIAAGTKKGALYMLSVMNNLTAGPYQLFNNQVLTDLTYSRVRKSLLGCCSEGGTVALFDTHANKMMHSFPSAHSSPVAAISFSPVNELLMVSVGYDKKLSCFNVQTKQSVMTHRSTAPLTSITFLGMGQLVALGTMTGQVLIHDMRAIRSPLATLKAHRTAVTNVLLQPFPKSKSVSSSKTSQMSSTASTLPVPTQRPSKSCSDQPTEMSPELRPKPESTSEANNFDDLSVFSPIRDTNLPTQIQTSEAGSLIDLACFKMDTPDSVTQSVFSPIRTTDFQHNQDMPSSHHMDINEDNLLSPIRDTTLITKNDSVNSESPGHQLKPPSAMEITVTTPENITDKENIEPSAAATKEHSSTLQQTECKSISTSCITDAPPLTMSFSTPSRLSPPKKRQLLRPVRASDLAPDTPPTQPKTADTLSTQPKTAAAVTASNSDMPVASHEVPQLQMELMRNCMVDVMEEFHDVVNSRLMHLQYIITKKFIQQEEVMEKLFRQYSLRNQELTEENERLRQQIEHLQAKY